MHCVVQKPFRGGGVDLKSNWLIDTAGWPIRRREQLIEQRFMRIASAEEIASAQEEDVDEKPKPRRSTRRSRSTKKTTQKSRRS